MKIEFKQTAGGGHSFLTIFFYFKVILIVLQYSNFTHFGILGPRDWRDTSSQFVQGGGESP